MDFETYPFYWYFLFVWLGLSLIIFPLLLTITAPYGRHTRKGWGPMINNTLGWMIMELPSALLFAWFFLSNGEPKSIVNWILFAFWQIHYIHRSLIFPLRQPNKSKLMPVMIMGSAIFFNVGNSYLNGFYLGTIDPDYSLTWLTDPRFIIGSILFFTGFVINIQSDNILFKLRAAGSKEYKIPYGGLFKWISCPNYFGEILEWTAWAILTWSLPGLTFCLWTMANLIPRALSNHKWYLKTFPNYPERRKAVFPFLV